MVSINFPNTNTYSLNTGEVTNMITSSPAAKTSNVIVFNAMESNKSKNATVVRNDSITNLSRPISKDSTFNERRFKIPSKRVATTSLKGTRDELLNPPTYFLSQTVSRKKRRNLSSIPVSGFNNEPEDTDLIHTYSFPNALVVQKKEKVLSESEKIYHDKYSRANVVLCAQMRTLGTTWNQPSIGFRGKKYNNFLYKKLNKGRSSNSSAKIKIKNKPKQNYYG